MARITKAKLLKSSWGCGQVEFCVDVEEEMRLEYGSRLKVKKKKKRSMKIENEEGCKLESCKVWD